MVVDSQKGKNVTGRMITARRSIEDVNAMEGNRSSNEAATARRSPALGRVAAGRGIVAEH
jgi:hypothetical protein